MSRPRSTLRRRVFNAAGIMFAIALAIVIIWLGGKGVLWVVGKIEAAIR